MTRELAIKLLRKDTSIDEIHRLRDNGLSHTEVTDAIQEAMDLGADAIEKTIAKKPIIINFYDKTDDSYVRVSRCSRCEEYVYRGEIYCSKCGQKLDWEVE